MSIKITNMIKKKINLGCGKYPKKDFINVDLDKDYGNAEIFHNLNCYPYPFKNNHFKEIELTMVLEHLDDPIKCLKVLNYLLMMD